jgi:hypothetical protein
VSGPRGAVCAPTSLRAGNINRGSIRGMGEDFFSLGNCVQTSSGVLPASYTMDCGDLFLEGEMHNL